MMKYKLEKRLKILRPLKQFLLQNYFCHVLFSKLLTLSTILEEKKINTYFMCGISHAFHKLRHLLQCRDNGLPDIFGFFLDQYRLKFKFKT